MKKKLPWYKSPNKIFLLASIIFWIVHLFTIRSDFHVLEPDEGIYYTFVKYILEGEWPLFRGAKYIEILPLYVFLAAKMQPLIGVFGPFAGLRLLAIFGGYIGGLSAYLFWFWKNKPFIGVKSALFYWLIPLSYFYTHTGTMESLFISGSFLSLVIYIHAQSSKKASKKKKYLILAGVIFALSILIKSTALIFAIPFTIITLYSWKKYRGGIFPFMIGFVPVFYLPMGWFFLTFKSEFIQEATGLSRKHYLPFANIMVHLATQYEYLRRLTYFLSLPSSLLLGYGVINGFSYLYKKRSIQALWIEILSILLAGIIFIYLFDYSPRYFMILIPGFSLILGYLLHSLKNYLIEWLILLAVLPSTFWAFQSTQHHSISQIHHQISKIEPAPGYIYTTIDPEKISAYIDQEAVYLSSDVFSTGGVVIRDTLKAELFANLSEPEFVDMWQTLVKLDDQSPIWEENNKLPHYPINNRQNNIRIYRIQPPE